jgi:hypothetical protein
VEFTSSQQGDSPMLPILLVQIPADQPIGTVTVDGTFDTRRGHGAIVKRGATAISLIRVNGRPWKEDCPAARERHETLPATRHFGRAFWKRLTSYHVRSRINARVQTSSSFGFSVAYLNHAP